MQGGTPLYFFARSAAQAISLTGCGIISERHLGKESALLCFLREARAAASVRHPNVASVLHLGRTGSSYFYTMEFVEALHKRLLEKGVSVNTGDVGPINANLDLARRVRQPFLPKCVGD